MQPVQKSLTSSIDSLGVAAINGKKVVEYLQTRPPIVNFPHYQREPYTLLSLSPERVFLIIKKKDQAKLDRGLQSSLAHAIDCFSGQRKVYYRTPLMKPKHKAYDKNEMRVREVIKGLEGCLHFEAVHYYTSLNNRVKRGAIAEYYPRGDLYNAIVNDRLTPPQRERIFRVLLSTLAKLHALNVIHRDIKPENILLTDEGNPIICDFGMATLNDNNPEAFLFIGGSPNYAAPELLIGSLVGLNNDVWSLGMVFFACLKGSLPWNIPLDDSIEYVYYHGMPDIRRSLTGNNVYEDVTRRMLTYNFRLRPRAEELVISGEG